MCCNYIGIFVTYGIVATLSRMELLPLCHVWNCHFDPTLVVLCTGQSLSILLNPQWALMYMWSGLLVDPSLLLPPGGGGGGADNDGDESDMGRLQGLDFVAS